MIQVQSTENMNNNFIQQELIKMLEEQFPEICDIKFYDGFDRGIPEVDPLAYNPRGNKHSFVVEWKIKATGTRRGYAVSPRLRVVTERRQFPLGSETYTDYDYSLDHVFPQLTEAIKHSIVSDIDVQIRPRFIYHN